MGIYLIIHVKNEPFIYQRLNRLESVCLLSTICVMIGLQTITKENQQFMNIFISFCLLIPLIVFIYNVSLIIILNCSTARSKYNMTDRDIQRVRGLMPRLPETLRNEMEIEIQQSQLQLNILQQQQSLQHDENERLLTNGVDSIDINDIKTQSIKKEYSNSKYDSDESEDEKEKAIPGLVALIPSNIHSLKPEVNANNATFMDYNSNEARVDSFYDVMEMRVVENQNSDKSSAEKTDSD